MLSQNFIFTLKLKISKICAIICLKWNIFGNASFSDLSFDTKLGLWQKYGENLKNLRKGTFSF